MAHCQPASAPLRSLLFHLADIQFIIRPSAGKSESITTEHHTILVFTNGTGCLHIDNNHFRFSPEKSYLVPPGASLQIESGCDSTLSYYQVTFTVIQVGKQKHKTYTEDLLPGRREITAYPFSRLMHLIEELYNEKHGRCELEWYKQHMRFQELMGFVFEHNLHSEHLFNPTQSVESTIQYMQNNYMKNITVKQLAQLANVPYWRFTPIFQELTGKKPLDYLTELRIKRSKELLLSSNEPLREIAHRVGFTDEYYFNRRFRQTTGITPKQYARFMRGRTRVTDWTGHEVEIPAQPKRVIYHGETFGDLLALGVEAIGGAFTWMHGTVYEDQVHNVHDVGFPIDSEKSFTLEPDLIIVADTDEMKYDRIARIAPTVTFDSFAPLDQRLLTLGNLLGRQREAKQWLDMYNAQATAMWQQLRADIYSGETATVFIYEHGHRLFVMGTAGLSSALYHPLGFKPGDKIQKILDTGHGFMEIPAEQLSAFAGDRIFMLLSGNPTSRQAAKDMMNSSIWNNLPAARNGHSYVLEAAKWNSGDALTRERLLDMLPRLLRTSSASGAAN